MSLLRKKPLPTDDIIIQNLAQARALPTVNELVQEYPNDKRERWTKIRVHNLRVLKLSIPSRELVEKLMTIQLPKHKCMSLMKSNLDRFLILHIFFDVNCVDALHDALTKAGFDFEMLTLRDTRDTYDSWYEYTLKLT